ncbi:MAG: glycosyltransferase, partial [Methylococcales bacterium]|nr:glycosyltransferase [Methylococcales bacterium]
RENLKKLAHDCGLDDSTVTFLGKRSDVPALLKKANLLVLTSEHEGFPNVVLEAMAAGLPVISTPAGDVSRVLEDNSTGFIINFDDVNGLADKIILFANSESLCQSMGHKGRQRVEQYYSVSELPERLFKIYAQAAHEQKRFVAEKILNSMLRKREII